MRWHSKDCTISNTKLLVQDEALSSPCDPHIMLSNECVGARGVRNVTLKKLTLNLDTHPILNLKPEAGPQYHVDDPQSVNAIEFGQKVQPENVECECSVGSDIVPTGINFWWPKA